MSAGRLNVGFAIAGVIGLVIIIALILLIVHAIFH
jgi:hypothetical protein